MSILAFFLILTQLILAVVSPVGLVYVSLLTGALPLVLSADQIISTPVGRLDMSAFRLLGLLVAAVPVLILNASRVPAYVIRYKFHFFFLAFCALTLIYAPSIEYWIRMMAKLVAPFVFLIVVLLAVKRERHLLVIPRLMIASALVIISFAILTKAIGMNPDPRFNLPGMGPAVFSAHIVAVAMFALAWYLRDRSFPQLIVVVILSAAVVAAFTRISIAALFIGFSVIMFFGTRGVPRLVLPIAGVVGLPALFLLNDTFRSRMFIDGGKLSAASVVNDPALALENIHGSGRFALWEETLNRFFDPNPLLGSGVGATQHYLYSHPSVGAAVVHSEYIRLLAEVGLIGLVLFVLVAAMYALLLLRNKRYTAPELRMFSLAGLGALVAYLIFIATDNGFDYVNQFGIYVFALVGLSEKAREMKNASAVAKGLDPLGTRRKSLTERSSLLGSPMPTNPRNAPKPTRT